jgi:hypothetical protein
MGKKKAPTIGGSLSFYQYFIMRLSIPIGLIAVV